MNLSLSRSDDLPELDWLDGVVSTLDSVCASLEPAHAAVGIVVVDDPFIRDINRRFRGRDRSTDVISFSYIDDLDGDDLAGEVYVSYETVARQARELDVREAHMFLRVAVHGLLHVLGHDHETDSDAAAMELREREILTTHLGPGPADALF